MNWSPTGTINPSNVSFARMQISTVAGSHLKIHLPLAGSNVTGSYMSTANLVLRTAQRYLPNVSPSCAGPGLGSLKIVPANPAAAISQGTW